jgi:hypothetical protein
MMVREAPDAPRLIGPAMRRAGRCIAPSCQVVASVNRGRERLAARHRNVA